MASVMRYNKDVKFVVMTDKQMNIPGAELYYIKPDRSLFKFREVDRMRDGVYYKFYLPQLPYDKILYIDCDVLCQRPLKDLWDEPCDFICATESHQYGRVQAAELGLQKYALTGMMLMNLKALREVNFTQKCLDKLSEVSPKWHDETIINVLFSDKIKFVDKKYNYCKNRQYDNPIPESDAYLLHYVGRQKKYMLKVEDFPGLETLKSELKDKSIAIVGNSSSILKKNFGEEIDSHDVVIRFNKGFPGGPVGNKTDIVFLACTLNGLELSRFSDAFRVRRSRLCQNACDFNVTVADRQRLVQTPTKDYKEKGLIVSQPSTGFIAINFVLSTQYNSIDLYGFDFFKEPTYYNPVGYKPLHNGDKEGEKILEYEMCGLLKIH